MKIDSQGPKLGSHISRLDNKAVRSNTANVSGPHYSQEPKSPSSTQELRDLVSDSKVRESLVTQFKVELQSGKLLSDGYLAKTADALLDR